MRRGATVRKRGGREAIFVEFGDSTDQIAACDEELIALDTALEELARLNPRQALMIESRFFGGLDIAETAALLEVSGCHNPSRLASGEGMARA